MEIAQGAGHGTGKTGVMTRMKGHDGKGRYDKGSLLGSGQKGLCMRDTITILEFYVEQAVLF